MTNESPPNCTIISPFDMVPLHHEFDECKMSVICAQVRQRPTETETDTDRDTERKRERDRQTDLPIMVLYSTC